MIKLVGGGGGGDSVCVSDWKSSRYLSAIGVSLSTESAISVHRDTTHSRAWPSQECQGPHISWFWHIRAGKPKRLKEKCKNKKAKEGCPPPNTIKGCVVCIYITFLSWLFIFYYDDCYNHDSVWNCATVIYFSHTKKKNKISKGKRTFLNIHRRRMEINPSFDKLSSRKCCQKKAAKVRKKRRREM